MFYWNINDLIQIFLNKNPKLDEVLSSSYFDREQIQYVYLKKPILNKYSFKLEKLNGNIFDDLLHLFSPISYCEDSFFILNFRNKENKKYTLCLYDNAINNEYFYDFTQKEKQNIISLFKECPVIIDVDLHIKCQTFEFDILIEKTKIIHNLNQIFQKMQQNILETFFEDILFIKYFDQLSDISKIKNLINEMEKIIENKFKYILNLNKYFLNKETFKFIKLAKFISDDKFEIEMESREYFCVDDLLIGNVRNFSE